MIHESDLLKARYAIRRGALPGEPISTCSCFREADNPTVAGYVPAKRCNGVCEDAALWVAKAIAAERYEYEAIVKAARVVCWFDWSDNDDDAVQSIELLRTRLTALALEAEAAKKGRKR